MPRSHDLWTPAARATLGRSGFAGPSAVIQSARHGRGWTTAAFGGHGPGRTSRRLNCCRRAGHATAARAPGRAERAGPGGAAPDSATATPDSAGLGPTRGMPHTRRPWARRATGDAP